MASRPGPIATHAPGRRSASGSRSAARPPGLPGPRAQALTLLGVGAAVFANALGNELILDAEKLIARNPMLGDPGRIPELLRSDYWWPELASGLYRPVVTLSWTFQHALGASSASAHNAINVLLHAGVCLLVWRLFRHLTTHALAFAGALLFATHAVHAEVVANAVGRAELLASLFALASFLGYLRARNEATGSVRWPLVCIGAYGLAVLSKENAAALLGLIVLYELVYGERGSPGERLRATWERSGLLLLGLVAMAAACAGLRLWALGGAALPDPNGIDNPLVRLDGAARLLTALQVLLIYGRLLLLPLRLSYDYSYDAIPLLDPAQPGAWAVLAAVVVLLALATWSCRGSRAMGFGLGFTLLALLPVSNLLVTTGTILGERLLYFPSIGFCLYLAVALGRLCDRFVPGERNARVALAALVLLLAVGNGARTWLRTAVWRSESRLVLHDVAVVPDSTKAQANAGKALQDLGRHDAAIAHFERALAIAPENSTVYTNWAYSLSAQGRHREAARLLEEQLRRGHGHAALYNNLGFILVDHEIDVPRGVALLERAVAERPDDAEFLDSLGWGYFKQGRLREARGALQRSLELAPGGPTRPGREAHLRAVEAALRDRTRRDAPPR